MRRKDGDQCREQWWSRCTCPVAQKKLTKQQKFQEKKAEKKAQEEEHKRLDAERKKREWQEKLEGITEEEWAEMIERRKQTRKERMAKRLEEKEMKMDRLKRGREFGVNVVIDMEFSHLMSGNEINSLCQQIMYCYAVNGRCESPCHLWLTGCRGEMENQLLRLPGFDKWIVERESRSYIEALQDQKDNLVYLTADSQNVLEVLNPKKYYIVGGIVDRNRWKCITMKKAEEQGIQTAKLPIGSYLKMCSSQALAVNQAIEILLKFVETEDWKDSFFQVIFLRGNGMVTIRPGLIATKLNLTRNQRMMHGLKRSIAERIRSTAKSKLTMKTMTGTATPGVLKLILIARNVLPVLGLLNYILSSKVVLTILHASDKCMLQSGM